MAFDWPDFLEIAKYLKQQGDKGFFTEAASRSAVSRAYYAAFCQARNFIAGDNRGYAPRHNHEDHIEVRKYFQQYLQQDPRYKNIHIDLERLHILRVKCDYEDEVDNIPLLSSSALDLSEKIINKLR